MRDAMELMGRACAASVAVVGVTCAAASLTSNGPGVYAVSLGTVGTFVLLGPRLTVTGWILVAVAMALLASVMLAHRPATIVIAASGLSIAGFAVLRSSLEGGPDASPAGYPAPSLGATLGMGVLFLGALVSASITAPRRKPLGGLVLFVLVTSAIYCWQSNIGPVAPPRAFGWYPLALTGIVLTIAAGWMARRGEPDAWLGFAVPAIGWLMVGLLGPALPSSSLGMGGMQLLGFAILVALMAVGRFAPLPSPRTAR